MNILYLSHGGGPLPFLNDGNHDEMIAVLKEIAKALPKPRKIIVVSAHWEAQQIAITAQASPGLLYDYYGFPEASYSIEYPVAGDPDLALKIETVLARDNMPARREMERGLDHGVFIPLKLMYPDADIPCVQVSLLHHLDPAEHIKLGEALSSLQGENVLLVGSGFSFHNMNAYKDEQKESNRKNRAFEQWLIDTCSNKNINEKERKQALIDWVSAPYARYCHPREEHLLPLHVCYGAAKRACDEYRELMIFDKKASMYLWTNHA